MIAVSDKPLAARTVGDVVADDYRLGTVFKRFGIDFCCGGGQTVADACRKRGIAMDELERALNESRPTSQHRDDAREWGLDFLVDYIVNVHHAYVRQQLPALIQFSEKVARVHGDGNPELRKVAEHVRNLAAEMLVHLEGEETMLFPYVKQLVNAQLQGIRPATPSFTSAEIPIMDMEDEHETAGALMHSIRELTSDFTPPDHACNTYRALFATLEEFEEDLHRHVHLENNILFPRALALEAELNVS